MSGLVLPFKDLIDECEAIKGYAGDLLDNKTTDVLASAKGTLQGIQRDGSVKPVRWCIAEDRPLCTKWSDRASQPGNKGKYRLRAKFSFVWQIRKLDEGKWRNSKYFLLDGLASSVTTLVAEVDGEEAVLARWATEVGDAASPGTHFHFQVNRPDSDELPFPKSLDIPRLPAPPMSPFLAVDFALGEIFQDRWRSDALQVNQHTNRWNTLQKQRLVRFFEWQAKRVRESVGSPWMALKLAKPPRELLVEDT